MSRRNTVGETHWQKKVIEYVGSMPRYRLWRQLNGNLYWKNEETGEFFPVSLGPPKGAADLTGYVLGSGRRLEIEMKSQSGTMKPAQENWRVQMMRANVVHLVAKYDESVSMAENLSRLGESLEKAAA